MPDARVGRGASTGGISVEQQLRCLALAIEGVRHVLSAKAPRDPVRTTLEKHLHALLGIQAEMLEIASKAALRGPAARAPRPRAPHAQPAAGADEP